jgi:outer membrane protein assembly factor BamB
MRRFNPRRYAMFAALLLVLAVATGCVGTRIGVSWPSLRTIGDAQQILVSYNEMILKIDPRTGSLAELTDSAGQTRFDPETGQPRLWRVDGRQIENAQFFSAPIEYTDNRLLVASAALRLLLVDDTAARVENPSGLPLGGVVVADVTFDDERVYVPLSEQGVQAFDLETLEQVWMVSTGNSGVWSKPIVADGVVYFSSMNHNVYAVDAATGETLWSYNLGGAAAGSPTLYEGHLYAGSFARKLVKLDLSGALMGELEMDNWVWSAPTANDGKLYVTDLGGSVYAIDAESFSIDWQVKGSGGGIRAAPLVTDEYVIVGSRTGLVEWLNRSNGNEVFERNVESEILSELLLIEPSETLNLPEPLVIVSTVNPARLLIAYTVNQGGQQWVYPPQ